MKVTDAQIRLGEITYRLFANHAGERFAPYDSEENTQILAQWGFDNLPGGLNAFANVGGWELAFSNCLAAGKLRRDPSFRTRVQIKKEFEEFCASLPAKIVKAIAENDINLQFNLLTESQKATLERIGGVAAFQAFSNEVDTVPAWKVTKSTPEGIF